MFVGKWWTFAAAAALEIAAGLNATFGLYAPAVQSEFGYSGTQLQGIGSALITSGVFAIVPGLVFDRLHHYPKFGPRLVTLVGGVFTALGYILSWASFTRRISSSYWLIILWQLLLCHGMAWLDTVAICTCILNFPMQQGAVGGTLKSFHGLGGSLPSAVFQTYSILQGISFTAFLAIIALGITLVALPIVNIVPWHEESEGPDQPSTLRSYGRMVALCGGVSLLVVYQLVTGLTTAHHPDTGLEKGKLAGTLAITFAVLLFIPFGIPLRKPHLFSIPDKRLPEREPLLEEISGKVHDDDGEVCDSCEAAESYPEALGDSEHLSHSDSAQVPKQFSPWDCVCSLDFWMFFVTMFIGSAAGFALLSNIGQQVLALGGKKGEQSTYVLALTASNVFGRLLPGFGSDWLLFDFSIPRTLLLPVLGILNVVAFLMAAFCGLQGLLVCMILAGFVLGGHWALMPACTSDLFGKRSFASNFALIHLSNSVGMLALNSGLVGPMYESVTKSHGEPAGLCRGHDCFRIAYIIIAGLSLGQAVLSSWLSWRSSKRYAIIRAQMKADITQA